MYDKECLDYFLAHQNQLFREPVADTPEEAEEFLDECAAAVCKNINEVRKYLDEVADVSGLSKEDLENLEEVFALPDGRYLVVDA